MTVFWTATFAMTLAALWVLLPALFSKPREWAARDRYASQLSVALYRDQLREIDVERRAGLIGEDDYLGSRQDIEAQLLADRPDGEQVASGVSSPSRWMAVAPWLILIALPATAFTLYVQLGNPGAMAPRPEFIGERHGVGSDQILAMVDGLAKRLRQGNGSASDWTMLARSLIVLGRYDEAGEAYAQAERREPQNADLLADYADALAMTQGRRLQGRPLELVQRALSVDPTHMKALALAGTAAFDSGHYSEAREHWRRALQNPAAQGSFRALLERNLEEADARLSGLAGEPRLDGDVQAVTPIASSGNVTKAPGQVDAAATRQLAVGVSGVVKLAPELMERVRSDDVVYIFARAAAGPPMPLAVQRKSARDLPATFLLDDASAMNPEMRLSSYDSVVVGARISRTGRADRQQGDLEGLSGQIANTGSGVVLVIDRIVQ